MLVKFVGDATSAKQAGKEAEVAVDKAADKAEKAAVKSSRAWDKFGTSLGKVGLAMTATVTAGAIALGNKFADSASDLNETVSKVNVIFQRQADTVKKWAEDSAENMGLAKAAAMDFAASYAGMFKGANIPLDQVTDMSTRVTQLAGDMASFFNTEVADMANNLRSALAGEAEPLRRFGVDISEAAVQQKALQMGLSKTGKDLDSQAKILARYAIIMDKTKDAQTDFARTSDGLANQQRILSAEWTNLQAKIGQYILPLKLKLVQVMRDLIDRFEKMSPQMQKFVLGMIGVAAAAGPLMLGLSGIIRTVTTIKAAFEAGGVLSKVAGWFTTAARSGGVLRTAIMALTGPVGWIVAAATAIYVAWVNNFGGIRQKVTKFVSEIWDWIRLRWEDIQRFTSQLGEFISQVWESIKETLRPVIDWCSKVFGAMLDDQMSRWRKAWEIISGILDLAMVGMNVLMGKGMDALSNSVKAGAMRMASYFYDFVADSLDALNTLLQGAKEVIDFMDPTGQAQKIVPDLSGRVKGWETMAKVTGQIADNFQKMADADLARLNKRSEIKFDPNAKNPFARPPSDNPWAPAGVGDGKELKVEVPDFVKKWSDVMEVLRDAQLGMGRTQQAAEDFIGIGTELGQMLEKLGIKWADWELMEKGLFQGKNMADILTKKFQETTGMADRLFKPPMNFDSLNEALQREIDTVSELNQQFLEAQGMIADLKKQAFDATHDSMVDQLRYRFEEGDLKGKFDDGTVQEILAVAEATERVIKDVAMWQKLLRDSEASLAEAFKAPEESNAFPQYIADLTKRMRLLHAGTEEERLAIDLLSRGMTEFEARQAVAFQKQVERLESMRDKIQSVMKSVENTTGNILDKLYEEGFGGFFNNVLQGFLNLWNQILMDYLKSAVANLINRVLGGIMNRAFGAFDASGIGTTTANGLTLGGGGFGGGGGPIGLGGGETVGLAGASRAPAVVNFNFHGVKEAGTWRQNQTLIAADARRMLGGR